MLTFFGDTLQGPRLRQDDPEAERFLQYFYDHCVLSLLQPLLELPEPKESGTLAFCNRLLASGSSRSPSRVQILP